MSLDYTKLNRWLNIRKTTIDKINKDLYHILNCKIDLSSENEIGDHAIKVIADYLNIESDKIIKDNLKPSYLFKSKNEILKSKRAIFKDKIHFYNYYTLPTPSGYVAPVLLDILCPKEKLPKLNNGHLEPAVTISMGPNDINARFHEKINKDTFVKFRINKNPKNNWIVGSSYFEPSFCKHSYSQCGEGLGRIISYTTKSFIENLSDGKLNDESYSNLVKKIDNSFPNRVMLKLEIENKGYNTDFISKKTNITKIKIKNFFNNKKNKFDLKILKEICKVIGSDYRLFQDKFFKEDSVGKLYYDYTDSVKSIRKFKSYTVASIANSKRYPDLSGYFMKVKSNKKNVLDLFDSKCSHYYITGGKITFNIKIKGKLEKVEASKDDCFWVSALTNHGFTGNGSILKISDGQNLNYLEKEDLINTYKVKNVLKRAKGDMANWGYDSKK